MAADSAILTNMKPEELENARRWVTTWRETGPLLERLKREELRKIDTQQALRNLSGMFESCRIHFSPRQGSGLVAQQDLFRLLKS